MNKIFKQDGRRSPSFAISIVPILALLGGLISILSIFGASAISDYSQIALISSGCLAFALAFANRSFTRRGLSIGLRRSARQILPAVPMLVFIATVSTTWMLSGVVPTLIDYGLKILNPTFFLVSTCVVCTLISVLTGSSWSTIATIGVAFMGIGVVLGYHPGWIAGAIISGAYFGDKVSPLSDTTVIASSTCGIDLFDHIRYLMLTSIPALALALLAFTIAGLTAGVNTEIEARAIVDHLHSTFNITPWVLVIPLITGLMIALRIPTVITLATSSLLGTIGVFVFQPGIVAMLGGDSMTSASGYLHMIGSFLWSETTFTTGYPLLDSLVSTGGITGMLPTITLVLSAMFFGSAMIGTGMLAAITAKITTCLRRRFPVVGSTVATGLFLNSCTADQYLSIIIGGNMYRNIYRRLGMEPRLLSRTLEDSISVTSVLIPWNSCGVTHSAVLGVNTLTYLPYCFFNYLSPLMSLAMAYTGFKIYQTIRPPKVALETYSGETACTDR